MPSCLAGAQEWQEHDWRNWRRRIYQPVARQVGITGDMRPRRLRASFVSLLLWEGRSLTYVADQVGAGVDTLARHYAGVIRELEGQPRVAAADAIRAARGGTRHYAPRRSSVVRVAAPSGRIR